LPALKEKTLTGGGKQFQKKLPYGQFFLKIFAAPFCNGGKATKPETEGWSG
jgi:hypothetical protein